MVGRTCMLNVNNLARKYAEILLAEGKITTFEHVDVNICVEFDRELVIDYNDFKRVLKVSSESVHELWKDLFFKQIILRAIETRENAIVKEVTKTRLVLESTEKTETICIRVTPLEKEALEREAKQQGITVSELIRSRVLQEK